MAVAVQNARLPRGGVVLQEAVVLHREGLRPGAVAHTDTESAGIPADTCAQKQAACLNVLHPHPGQAHLLVRWSLL
jgi:hypothetical protein